MQCPVDGTVLQMTERSGIEIDYCPQCRGVWLDRGELDKMIGQVPAQPAHQQQPPHGPQYHHQSQPQQHRQEEYRHDEYRHDDHNKKHHKKENFLGDLFDF